jgi:hypothetical protein
VVFILLGLVWLFFCLPAIIGTLIYTGIVALIAGPIILIGLIGLSLVVQAQLNASKPKKSIVYSTPTPYKPIMVPFNGKQVPIGVFIYSILSSIIIAPILILLFILFCPAVIALPLIFVTIGVEIGRWCGHKQRKPGIQRPAQYVLFKGKGI